MTNLLNLKNDDGEIHLNDERMIHFTGNQFYHAAYTKGR